MREKIFSMRVRTKHDMSVLEDRLGGLMGGEQNRRCALVRSQEFIALRLCALYKRGGPPPLSVYGHNLQVCLDRDGNVTIYLLSSDVDPDPECALLGKRAAPGPADEEPDL